MGTSYIPGYRMLPLRQRTAVPVLLFTPMDENHWLPFKIISGA